MVWIPKEPKYKPKPPTPHNTPTNTPTDLVSRESVLAEFQDGRDVYDIMESIESLPSADVVEVVRCENCIFYEKALSVQGFCHNHGSIVSANAFCSYGSYGKRREDGEA